MKKTILFFLVGIVTSVSLYSEQKAEYFTKLYDGDYRLRGEVVYFQVYKAKVYPSRKKQRPVTLLTVNGKNIEDDTVAFELLPGNNTFNYYCVGRDGENYESSITLALTAQYFYELNAISNRADGCLTVINKLGKKKIPNSEQKKLNAKTEKGKPLPSSKPFNTWLDFYESSYPNEIWPNAANAIYQHLIKSYDCSEYSVLRVKSSMNGRIWRDSPDEELKIEGDLKEYWTIRACGKKRKFQLVFEKPGTHSKYFSIY